jgi:hypothetical protein
MINNNIKIYAKFFNRLAMLFTGKDKIKENNNDNSTQAS